MLDQSIIKKVNLDQTSSLIQQLTQIHHTSKCKIYNYKILEENKRVSLCPEVRQRALRHDTKTMIHERLHEIKNYSSVRDGGREGWREEGREGEGGKEGRKADKAHTGRNICKLHI